MQHLKTRVWTRISVVALLAAVLAGAFTGGVLVRANADAQEKTPPEPRRTAYVDFLHLLKKDTPLKRKREEMAIRLEELLTEKDQHWQRQVDEQQEIMINSKVDSRAYRRAMQEHLDAERKRYLEKLELHQIADSTLRDFGIERFNRIKELVWDVARKGGYNEVLNIVRNIEEVAGREDDFEALQQQLLVSPVLYYEEAHDITAAVDAEAQARWGEHISFVEYDPDTSSGGISFTPGDEKEPVKRNADDEIEIRLGQTGQFGIEVLDKGEPAEGERAVVRWSRRNDGTIAEDTGEYTAPEEFPARGDIVVITVRSAVDPTVTAAVIIRLLDKDGNRKPEDSQD